MTVFNLIVLNVSNEEEVEVFVNTYAKLESALAAQQEAIEREKEERSDEDLTTEEYEDYETVLLDSNGGYVIFKVQETVLE